MQTPPASLVSTSTTALTASSSVSTSSFTPASPPSRPSTQPPSGLFHAMRQLLKRSRLREGSHGADSSQALTDRSPRLPAGSLPHQATRGDDKGEAKATKDAKPATTKHPGALADVWPGHAFTDGPGKALCEVLLVQRGRWNEGAIDDRLSRLDAAALAEFGEFAARLQDHPALRQAPVLSQLLTRLAVPPSWPVAGIDGVSPGLPEGWDPLASGLARGLILTGQTYSLQQLLKASAHVERSVRLAGLVRTVITLHGQLADADLGRALGALHNLPVPYADSVLAQCRGLARSAGLPLAGLHRLVRLACPYPQESIVPYEAWHTGWFRILETPPAGEEPLAPERHFAIGHALGRGCDHHALRLLRPALEGKDATGAPAPELPSPQPAASARAGVLWALDPLACLAALPRDPDGMRHVQAWAALPEAARRIDPALWHRSVEALDIPALDRLQLQRIVALPPEVDSKAGKDRKGE